jgi:hypothetical protein
MTKEQLTKVKNILLKIKNQDAFVCEAVTYVDRDLALRDQQKKAMRDNMRDGYDY